MQYLKKSLFLIIIILMAQSAWGQPTIDRFLISVWPEYDHPGVLVIFNGAVGEDELPLEMSYSIPENSRFALVVGTTDTTDRPQPIPIEDAIDAGKQITFDLIKPEFNVTFYYNPFQSGNAHRHYGYEFVSNIGVDTLLIDLQVPLMAEGFEPEMPVDEQMQDSHGINYYRATLTDVAPGDTVHIEAHYENPDGQLTSNLLSQQMGGQMGGGGQQMPPPGGNQTSGSSFWLIAAIAVIVLGVLYYLTQGRRKPTPLEESAGSPEQAEPGAAAVKTKAKGPGGSKYCIHCGAKIPADAKFCTSCGEKQAS